MILPILTYHRLLAGKATRAADPKRIAVSAAQFRSHLTWLQRLGYRTVSLPGYVAALKNPGSLPRFFAATPGRPFAITFDDGYEEVLTIGLPLLREFGFTATIFAVSGELGGMNRWDGATAKLLSAEQYARLIKGGMSVGAHTRTHPHLPKLFDPQAKDELAGAKADLEKALGIPVPLLAYPYGESNDRVERLAQEAGYDAAFATDRAPVDHTQNRYRLRRAVVFPKNSSLQIYLKVQEWYARYQDGKRSLIDKLMGRDKA